MPGRSYRLGTRTQQNFRRERLPQGQETRSYTRDLGMTKRVVASCTFVNGATKQIQAANGAFANTFAVGDPILVEGANLNNGFFTVTALDGVNNAYLGVDPGPKNEGPIAVTIRTP